MENYTSLLAKLFDFETQEEYPDTIQELQNCLKDDLSLPNQILLRKSLAFLLSRPEWFFCKDRAHAQCLLREACDMADNGHTRDKLELELLLLEIDQATKHGGAPSPILIALLNRLTPLLKTLSPSDKIMALSAGVSLYETLAQDPAKTTKMVDTNRRKKYVKSPATPQPTQPSSQDVPEIEDDSSSSSSSSQSTKAEIVDQARQAIQNQERKQQIKQERVPKSTSETSSSLTNTTVNEAPPPVIKKEINPHAMALFNLLWQENASTGGSWENRSFRNDIKITRKQALQLIEVLGGAYHSNRGKGSHLVAYVTFNDQNVGGIYDLEKYKGMITLTKDKDLKYYQIKHLRNILIKQGFNPDTVALKNSQGT